MSSEAWKAAFYSISTRSRALTVERRRKSAQSLKGSIALMKLLGFGIQVCLEEQRKKEMGRFRNMG